MQISRWISSNLALITVLAGVAAYLQPAWFLPVGQVFQWLFAITMLALGLVLDSEELLAALRRPGKIGIGVASQFTIMPLLAAMVAWVGGFPSEIALGFIIVGCAPGAMASNVIVYLAGGLLAYSLAMTTVATLLSPLLTPAWVKLLADAHLNIAFIPLFKTIVLTVLLPVVSGMALRQWFSARLRQQVEFHAPALASIAIVLICSYAIAKNQAAIADAALPIMLAVVILNIAGYALGWLVGAGFAFDTAHRKTLSIEIGMQNAGMGVVLALAHFSPLSALPGALFATWSVMSAALFSQWMQSRQRKMYEQSHEGQNGRSGGELG